MTDEKNTKEEVKDEAEVAKEEAAAVLGDEGAAAADAPVKRVKKSKRQVHKGQARIQSTYNNTIVTITDLNGQVLGWSSAGVLGFKGAKKSTPYAASQVVADVVEKIAKHGVKELQVYVKGVGTGRDAAVRALAGAGFDISLIKDTTAIPHNGCRRRRPRRV